MIGYPLSALELTAEGRAALPVLDVSSAVLCPECLGDWCAACGHTGLSRPTPAAAAAPKLPGGGGWGKHPRRRGPIPPEVAQ